MYWNRIALFCNYVLAYQADLPPIEHGAAVLVDARGVSHLWFHTMYPQVSSVLRYGRQMVLLGACGNDLCNNRDERRTRK